MGLTENFSVVPGKPHAFKSKNVGFIINSQKKVTYSNGQALKDQLLKRLNDDFPKGECPHIMSKT